MKCQSVIFGFFFMILILFTGVSSSAVGSPAKRSTEEKIKPMLTSEQKQRRLKTIPDEGSKRKKCISSKKCITKQKVHKERLINSSELFSV